MVVSFFRGGRDKKDATALIDLQLWPDRPSIYSLIETELRQSGGALPDEFDLPAQDQDEHPSGLRWAPGARDGVVARHERAEADSSDGAKDRILIALERAARYPSARRLRALHESVTAVRIVKYIDDLLQETAKNEKVNSDQLRGLARWLATTSPESEPVKLGISLLGIVGDSEDSSVVKTLALYDEFTLFCLVAVANMSDRPVDALWEIAKRVSGWGRIHAVERLSEYASTDAKIRNWLLREGFKNRVMHEYLAHTCAATGDLGGALESADVDDELLASAGELLRAMISGGSTPGIHDYSDAPRALDRYLYHLAAAEKQLDQLLVLRAIHEHLLEDKTFETTTTEALSLMLGKCETLLEKRVWQDLILDDLYTDDESRFWLVAEAAKVIDIDIWERHWDRLVAKPLDSGRWFRVVDDCTEEQIDQILAFAERSLELDRIANRMQHAAVDDLPPWDEECQALSCLDAVLQGLLSYSGRGWAFIHTALLSQEVGRRNMALQALESWKRDAWSNEVHEALTTAQARESDDDVRLRMRQLLTRTPLDE